MRHLFLLTFFLPALACCQTAAPSKPISPEVQACADAPEPAERCIALAAAACDHLEKCGLVDRLTCMAGQIEPCEAVQGITAAEFASCAEAIRASACQDPMPLQCGGIAERKPGHRPPTQDRTSSRPDQKDI